MRILVALGCLLSLAVGEPAPAQMPGPGAVERFGLEPLLARHYADALALTNEQLFAVEQELREAKARHGSLSVELRDETARWAALLATPKAVERDVLAQLDRVLEVERRIKHVNVLCSLRVRRHLTAAQIRRLQQLEIPPPPPPRPVEAPAPPAAPKR